MLWEFPALVSNVCFVRKSEVCAENICFRIKGMGYSLYIYSYTVYTYIYIYMCVCVCECIR